MKINLNKALAAIALSGLFGLLSPLAAQATPPPAIAAVSANQNFTAGSFSAVHFDSTALSGFTGTVEVRVSVQSGAGLLHVTSATGMTLLSGYSDAVAGNAANLGYSGSQSDANAMLATLQYKGDTAAGADNIRIDVTNQLAAGSYPIYGGHAYSLITTSNITWSAARTAAAALTVPKAGGGTCPGYLATLNGNGIETNLKGSLERAFLASDLPTTTYTWIGASDAAVRGTWQWVTDPDDPTSIFWLGYGSGARQNGFDANWNTGEPNNSGNNEIYAQITLSPFTWNDSSASANSYDYYVEFGSNTCQPQVVADNEVVSIASLNTISEPSAVTSLSAARDGNSARLNWTAPANGGSAITDYEVAFQSEGAAAWTTVAHATSTSTTIQIPAIDGNGAYNFRVRALNAVGPSAWATASIAAPKPWTGPTIGVQPSSESRHVPTTGGTLEIVGSGFDETTSVKLNGTSLSFDSTDSKLIRINIPAGAGSPDLLLASKQGSVLYQNAFDYVAPKLVILPITLSFSGRAWTATARSLILAKLNSEPGYRSISCSIAVGASPATYKALREFCLGLRDKQGFGSVNIIDARKTSALKNSQYRLQFGLSE